MLTCIFHVSSLFSFQICLSETASVLALLIFPLSSFSWLRASMVVSAPNSTADQTLLKITAMVFSWCSSTAYLQYSNLIVLCFTSVYPKHDIEEHGMQQYLPSTLSSLFQKFEENFRPGKKILNKRKVFCCKFFLCVLFKVIRQASSFYCWTVFLEEGTRVRAFVHARQICHY